MLHIQCGDKSCERTKRLFYFRFFMNDIPIEKIKWVHFFQQTYDKLDRAFKIVKYCCNSIQVISIQLYDFLDRFNKITNTNITQYQASKCYEFSKACASLLGFCSVLSETRWLSYFIQYHLHHPYKVMMKLWQVWQDCSETMMFTSFEFRESLAFAFCQDLIKVHTLLSTQIKSCPIRYKDQFIIKLSQIQSCLQQPQFNEDLSKNSYVIKHSEWTIIKENIGSGGYASVHLARLKSTNELVAVKEMKASQLYARRIIFMKREIDALMKLNHPNTIRLIGVTVTPPFCIVTNLIPNGSFTEYIIGNGPLTTKGTPIFRLRIMLDSARGMEYLHALGLMHRDFKPLNILIDENERGVLCDFGLSRPFSGKKSGDLGTMQWIAPELLQHGVQYDESVDVYAFGITLWVIATSKNPYTGMRQMQYANLVISENLRPTPPDDQPPEFIKLMQRCWDSNPKKRPTFREIRQILESGTVLMTGVNKEEYLSYVKKTQKEHLDILEKVKSKKSPSEKNIGKIQKSITFWIKISHSS